MFSSRADYFKVIRKEKVFQVGVAPVAWLPDFPFNSKVYFSSWNFPLVSPPPAPRKSFFDVFATPSTHFAKSSVHESTYKHMANVCTKKGGYHDYTCLKVNDATCEVGKALNMWMMKFLQRLTMGESRLEQARKSMQRHFLQWVPEFAAKGLGLHVLFCPSTIRHMLTILTKFTTVIFQFFSLT